VPWKGFFLSKTVKSHVSRKNIPEHAGNEGGIRRIILEKCRTEFYNM
jgi:hypothetical protein